MKQSVLRTVDYLYYHNSLIDPRASRSIHCPDQNACFLPDCRVTHFGFGIPVVLEPVEDQNTKQEQLVALSLDTAAPLDPRAAGFLLNHHDDFKGMSLAASGGTTGAVRDAAATDDDIAAIAKQISDHAEAIYQTWKSRGLAPTEILKCHGNVITRGVNNVTPSSPPSTDSNPGKIGGGLNSSVPARTSQLERLVNKFVVEDKARRKPQSSIETAVRKFEATRAQPTQISRPIPANPDTVDTIEVIFPEEIVHKNRVLPWSKNSQRYLDEVQREEERLIQALKCGTVVTDDPGGGSGFGGVRKAPHPELTDQQKQHLRQQQGTAGTNPVRPFLTRGSVAERVLIFEKCPTELLDKRRQSAPAVTAWRGCSEVQSKAQSYSRENQRSNQPAPHTTLQRHTKANKNIFIPRFYFPQGRPPAPGTIDGQLQKLVSEFRTFPLSQIPRDKVSHLTRACELPLYCKVPLFLAAGGEKLGYLEAHSFIDFWKQVLNTCHDSTTKFVRILTRAENRKYLLPEDFVPLVQDIVDTHPGLTFLKEATEFHSRYVHTVIARIFYCVNRSWSGRISIPELRRSNLLKVITSLEAEEDINLVTQYFSYEHFYVIYCKFWELDLDHDLYISRRDLARHNDHALSSRIIDRIFSGAVTRGGGKNFDKMSYTEFVWFLLSEEDKQHHTAIEYWFRCMDLDGDGFLSMYELEYFYEEQLQRMELLGIETLPFEDCLCQMLDMIKPTCEGKISLTDLKKCKMVTIFFDTFFNLEKYLDHEQKDPFASQRDHDDPEVSDWDRYAAEEYELLVAEEGGVDHNNDIAYDTDQSDDIEFPDDSNLLSEDSKNDVDIVNNGHVRIKVQPPPEVESTIVKLFNSGANVDIVDRSKSLNV